MSAWESIREARAESAAAVFRELGVRVDLVHDGATAERLVAYLERASSEFDGALARAGTAAERVFHLPRQAGFEGAVRPGDILIYPSETGPKYCVHAVECDAHESVYRIRARRWPPPVGFMANGAGTK